MNSIIYLKAQEVYNARYRPFGAHYTYDKGSKIDLINAKKKANAQGCSSFLLNFFNKILLQLDYTVQLWRYR